MRAIPFPFEIGAFGERAGRLLPSAIVATAIVSLAWRERGSIAAPDWLAYLLLAGVLVAAVLLSGGALAPSRTALLAGGGLAGAAVWAAASASWSAAPALARDEALLRGLYLLVLLVPVLTLRTAADRTAAVALLVAAAGVLVVVTALELLTADDPSILYDEGRPYFPITYPNALAAFFLTVYWPGVVLASRHGAGHVPRALALATVTGSAGVALMAQSKGGVLAFAVSSVAFFALTPLRLRALFPALAPLALVALAFGPLTEPIRADDGAPLVDAIRDSGRTLLLLLAAGAVLGLVYALADRRVRLSQRALRRVGAVVAVLAALAVAGGVAAFAVVTGHPAATLEKAWDDLHAAPVSEGSTHFATLGSHRFDFWRVSLDDFEAHPVAGIGARGFAASYLEHGDSIETPARAHSLPMDVLGEEGAVGAALMLLFLLPLLGFLVGRGRRAAGAAALAAAAILWLAHASVDWNWSFPAVGLPFAFLAGIALSAGSGGRVAPGRARLAAAAAVVVALLAVPPWLSARLTTRALQSPAGAASDLRWARRLDPLSSQPLLAQWQLAPTPQERIDALRAALEREPRSFGVRYLLGLAYKDAGQTAAARRELETARRLAPHVEAVRVSLDSLDG